MALCGAGAGICGRSARPQSPDACTPTTHCYKLGLIADIQYADKDDGTDFSGREQRHFRGALEVARKAAGHWNAANVDAVLQLGDIIDGWNQCGQTKSALRSVLDALGTCKANNRYDVIGNHDLYNFPRASLPDSGLRCFGDEGNLYRMESLNAVWEAVILDGYEQALINPTDEGYDKALNLIQQQNPQVLQRGNDWFAGVPREKHRYVPYNGAVSSEQLAWLDGVLQSAAFEGKKVVVFSHVPLFIGATKEKNLLWNAEAVLKILHAYRDTVVAVFAGHDHDGGYAVDPAGLHHVTMNGVLTADTGSDCCAVLECYDDGSARFVAYGRACVASGTFGDGAAYAELQLNKGAVNEPSLPARRPVEPSAAEPVAPDVDVMRAARLARLDPARAT